VITFGWGMGVFVRRILRDQVQRAHLNPAVTMAMAAAEDWMEDVPVYIGVR